MNPQTTRQIEIIQPMFTESSARESIEKKQNAVLLRKKIQWHSSVPLYIPFWLVDVEMDLKAPGKGVIQKTYPILVNAITNRGMLVRGELKTKTIQTRAIIMDQEIPATEAKETARFEALTNTRRMIRPPAHRVLPGERLIWYPLALVELTVNGKEDVQLFDYYRGGLDKMTMRFFRLKEKLEAAQGRKTAG